MKKKINKTIAATLLASTVAGGAIGATTQVASAAPATGAGFWLLCVLNGGDYDDGGPDGSAYCVYEDWGVIQWD